MNLGVAFLNDGVPELLGVNLLLTSLTIQRFRMWEVYSRNLVPEKEHKVFPEVSIIYSEMVKALKPC